MASDTSLVFNLVTRDRASQALGPIAAKLNSFGTKIGTAVAGVGVAAPYVSAAAAAAGGLAVGAAAAGAAVMAFKVAAGPQLQSVTDAWGLYDAAQKAAGQGGEQAAAANKAYADALAQMTPATRATAKEFVGLKSDFGKWSDSLSGTTMPIFTRGLQGLRAALPALTPLVKAAGGALGGFVDDVAKGLGSGGFKSAVASFAGVAGPALRDFLAVVKNVASGVGALLGGLFKEFVPVSKDMTGGLVSMSAAFADWAKGVNMSSGFARFLSLAKSGGGALGNLGAALGQLVVDLAPFLGATTIIAQALANFIGAIPTPVITLLAKAFIAASVGMKAWAIGTAIWSGITKAATAVQWAMNTALLANPITWVIIGIVALIAVIVLIATKTTWFQTAWHAMSAAVVAAWNWVWNLLKQGFALLTQLFLNFTGPGLIIKHWDTIKRATTTAWTAVWNFIKAIPGRLVQLFLNFTLPGLIIKHWSSIRSGTIRIATATVNWVKGLPGRLIAAVSSLASRLYAAGAGAWNRFRSANIAIAMSAVAWVRGLPSRISGALGNLGSLLVGKGHAVVQGLWSGIQSMGGWLRSQIMGWAKSVVPGPIAKALGISSPSKVTTAQGRWIAQGLIDGLTGSTAQVRTAAGKVADIVRDAMAPGARRSRALDVIGDDTDRLVRLANRQGTVALHLKDAQKKLSDLQKARTSLADEVRGGILNAANITRSMDDERGVTASSILDRLKDDVGAARAFAANLEQLRKKGVSKDLIKQIASAGVEGGSATATALANANSGQIKAINDQQKALTGAAGQAGTAAGDAMYQAGIHSAAGLVKGLRSQEKAIENQMLRIAKSMSRAIRKALRIASPSGLMSDEVGQFVPPGIMAGVRKASGALASDLTQWAAATVPGAVHNGTASTGRSLTAAAPMGSRGRPIAEVRLVADQGVYNDLLKLMRRMVRTEGQGSAQKAFGQGNTSS